MQRFVAHAPGGAVVSGCALLHSRSAVDLLDGSEDQRPGLHQLAAPVSGLAFPLIWPDLHRGLQRADLEQPAAGSIYGRRPREFVGPVPIVVASSKFVPDGEC